MRCSSPQENPKHRVLAPQGTPQASLLSVQVLLLRAIPIRECWAWHSVSIPFHFPDPLREALSPTSPFYRWGS